MNIQITSSTIPNTSRGGGGGGGGGGGAGSQRSFNR